MPSSKDPVINRQKAREWRLANPDKHRESTKLWARKKRASLGKEGRAAEQLKWKVRDPVGYILHHAQQRAKSAGVPFNLTREDLVMPDVCPVLGLPFEWGVGQMGWRNMRAPSLDKIKPQLGYISGNVRIISNRANHLKSNGTISEFEAVIAYMKREGCNRDLDEQGQRELPLLPAAAQLNLGW